MRCSNEDQKSADYTDFTDLEKTGTDFSLACAAADPSIWCEGYGELARDITDQRGVEDAEPFRLRAFMEIE